MKSKKEIKNHPPEFRENAVKLALSNDRSRAATARELGINVNTLHGLVAKYREERLTGHEEVDEISLRDQVKALKKENGQLKEEREILKKASAYFASHMS